MHKPDLKGPRTCEVGNRCTKY